MSDEITRTSTPQKRTGLELRRLHTGECRRLPDHTRPGENARDGAGFATLRSGGGRMTLRTTWLDDDADRREAVGVAARAMRDNPMSLALSDDPLVRLDILCGMFTDTLTKGTVAGARTRECVLGVAAVGGPGRCVRYMLPAEQRVRSDPDPDASPLDRLVRVASVMAD
ncbi:MAG TPA: hypothetical protein VN636_19730, partial [Acidimicrobiia bacterium]|nr:hypothetical protein [Acidimicrobiia bacterium]